ncbi:hypothetical protein KUV47_19095 [Vannielia litorea]|uniref:hypothetical protein n=1 Tax=Vannielia litorea TaxID=1217970 RepID=UPI001C961A91|nr:hypothetical protein [Vannielia litorea]MBY6050017.1 hypothetical protein [Vannielia litorea]MBY6077431.1 hypothetical protein [Vannielia litorea]MBY6155338.1 hypothetical protein [Vannielia litorea]
MAQVSVLQVEDEVRLDPDRLGSLYYQLGDQGAEDVVCRAMEELAVRLADVDAHFRAQDWDGVARLARGLIAIAEQIGMVGLARVAGDVARSARALDFPAISATLARLGRIADRSLTEVWDTQDLSV